MCRVRRFYLVNVYVPNSGAVGAIGLQKDIMMIFKVFKNLNKTKPVILCGDLM